MLILLDLGQSDEIFCCANWPTCLPSTFGVVIAKLGKSRVRSVHVAALRIDRLLGLLAPDPTARPLLRPPHVRDGALISCNQAEPFTCRVALRLFLDNSTYVSLDVTCCSHVCQRCG